MYIIPLDSFVACVARKRLRNQWDAAAPDEALLEVIVAKADEVVIWGGNYFPLPPSRGWLV